MNKRKQPNILYVFTDQQLGRMMSCAGNREQLFDLDADPGEMTNLAAKEDCRKELQRHREYLREWCRRTNTVSGMKSHIRVPMTAKNATPIYAPSRRKPYNDSFGRHYAHPEVPFMIPGDEYCQPE